MTRLWVAVENTPGEGFAAEHGLSLWIAHQGLNILYDTGAGQALLPNLERLGLDPAVLDGIVLSHGHYDHMGGLDGLLKKRGAPIDVWCHAGCFGSHLMDRGQGLVNIGPPLGQAAYEALGARFRFIEDYAEPWPGLRLLARVPRLTPYEVPRPELLARINGELAPDPFPDDLAVLLDAPGGPALLTGCAHAGVVNILNLAEQKGGRAVSVIIGGTHLGPAEADQRRATAAELAGRPGLRVISGHCTLDAAADLAAALGARYTPLHAGLSLEL